MVKFLTSRVRPIAGLWDEMKTTSAFDLENKLENSFELECNRYVNCAINWVDDV